MFWSSALQYAAKLDTIRVAEAKLLEHAKKYLAGASLESLKITPLDTPISRSVIPWKDGKKVSMQVDLNEKEDQLIMHSIHIERKVAWDGQSPSSDAPLVLVHGYMNAAAYFYRNLVGLSRHFSSIYSLDLLGWGLSSRPDFQQLKDTSIEVAEEFFVESLEAWRVANRVDRMILAGHSMGGYLSVAYCERYPQHVERLILLSPVGVNDDAGKYHKERKERIQSSFRSRIMYGIYEGLFNNSTPGVLLRSIGASRSYSWVLGYIQRRLPEIDTIEEQTAVADYLFHSNTLPGSGEYGIQRVLKADIIAKRPLQNRIPKLQVDKVSFLYGSHDWMDINGGIATQLLCTDPQKKMPDVDMHIVDKAGHLLMLQNWQAVNAGIIQAGGGSITKQESQDLKLVKPTAQSATDVGLAA